MGPTREDDELVYAIRHGDQAAFAHLVQRHRAWVWRLITAVVQDHARAEDVTQEVFSQVYQHLDDYDPRGKFVVWLKRIAINRARNHLRDHGREIAASAPLLPDQLYAEDRDADPEVVLASVLLRQEVRAALLGLSVEHREVLAQHYFGGLDIQEIAERIGCPVGTIKSRLFNGRRQLRLALLSIWQSNDQYELEDPV